jgi:hypothetical protein
MYMVRQCMALGFGGNAFERILGASTCIFLGQHVMRMIVYDWIRLYYLSEVVFCSIVEVLDVMEGRIGFGRWSHIGFALCLVRRIPRTLSARRRGTSHQMLPGRSQLVRPRTRSRPSEDGNSIEATTRMMSTVRGMDERK